MEFPQEASRFLRLVDGYLRAVLLPKQNKTRKGFDRFGFNGNNVPHPCHSPVFREGLLTVEAAVGAGIALQVRSPGSGCGFSGAARRAAGTDAGIAKGRGCL